MKKINTWGFTLIELLVVIAVLGVLAAGVFVAINPLKRIQQAQDAKIKSDIGQIAQAEQAYFTSNSITAPTYAIGADWTSSIKLLTDSKDLKVVPVPPETVTYNITGTSTDIAVWAQLTEVGSGGTPTTNGWFCWMSSNGKAGVVTTTPSAATCPGL